MSTALRSPNMAQIRQSGDLHKRAVCFPYMSVHTVVLFGAKYKAN